MAQVFSIVFLPKADRTAFAVSISKKVLKDASDRNKIRRRIYSALSEVKKYPKNTYVVFVPKKDIVKTSFDALKKEIEDSFSRAKIL